MGKSRSSAIECDRCSGCTAMESSGWMGRRKNTLVDAYLWLGGGMMQAGDGMRCKKTDLGFRNGFRIHSCTG